MLTATESLSSVALTYSHTVILLLHDTDFSMDKFHV